MMSSDRHDLVRWRDRIINGTATVAELGLAGDGRTVVRGLASDRDPVVRAWAIDAAAATWPTDMAIELIRPLLDDTDPDVAQIARDHLLVMSPSDRHHVLARLRRQAASRNQNDAPNASAAIYQLADLGDSWSLGLLQQIEADPAVEYLGHAARVARYVLEGDDKAVAELIRHHREAKGGGVELPAALAGAVRMPTPAVRNALEACATTDSDPSCRAECAQALAALGPLT